MHSKQRKPPETDRQNPSAHCLMLNSQNKASHVLLDEAAKEIFENVFEIARVQ